MSEWPTKLLSRVEDTLVLGPVFGFGCREADINENRSIDLRVAV